MPHPASNEYAMLDVGFGNALPKNRIVCLVAYDSDPIHRHVEEMEKTQRVIDATKGRKVKTVVFLDTNHLVLSATARETLVERLQEKPQVLAAGL